MSENDATTTVAKKEHKVIIIGAGCAGLSAANHLIKNGLTDFRILEARGRTGGRIVSIDLAAEKVSLCFVCVYFPLRFCAEVNGPISHLLHNINVVKKRRHVTDRTRCKLDSWRVG